MNNRSRQHSEQRCGKGCRNMELYLLRHGIAVDRGSTDYATDAARPLTPDGERKMRQIAKGMKALGITFDMILASPNLRTQQTAKVVAKFCKAKVILTENLAPEGNVESLIEEINANQDGLNSILLVGHEPDISRLISLLVADSPDLVSIAMRKGGLCKLSLDILLNGRCASLEWLLTPRQLVRLGEG
jgi:phosphohistidine phosphatase